MASNTPVGSRHEWHFFRFGGFDQVVLRNGADLAALDQLDLKLWVALSCPTTGLEFDTDTLALIDTDKDGRIRVPEILAAVRWACAMLKDPGVLIDSKGPLPLAAINDSHEEGRALLVSARQILANLGTPEAQSVSVDETADTVRWMAQTLHNGDGIVIVEATTDPAVAATLNDMIACLGGCTDRSGKPGVDLAMVDRFFEDLDAYTNWWARGEAEAETLLPLGIDTPAAVAALTRVRAKVDDFFARSRLAAYDERAIAALNRQESDYLAVAAADLTITAQEVAGFPLARIDAEGSLPLKGPVNPAWADALTDLRVKVIRPLLGDREILDESEWRELQNRLAAYEAWAAGKAGASVEKLGIDRVRQLLAGDTRAAILEMIEQDLAVAPQFNAISGVDKLARFHRDLARLLHNFINFRNFYRGDEKAVFQVGRLYLDERCCELCVRVDDVAKHAAYAGQSNAFLAYCDVVRRATGEKMSIVAAFTAGDSDYLMVGRNGVFYDRQGRDWDATIVRIVENPISVRQAFWSPYKRLIRFIQEQVAKRAAAADAAANEKLTGATEATAQAAETGKAPAAKPKIDIGTLAAIGVAVGGITAAMGMLLQAFFGLGMLMPLGILALILLISLPSMLIAWLKLRQRCLGPILDANGWAVNARAWINLPFGRSLTSIAKLPPGSHRDLIDPYAEPSRTPRLVAALVVIVLLAIGLWWFGVIERWQPGLLPKSPYMTATDPTPPPTPETPAAIDPAAPTAPPEPQP